MTGDAIRVALVEDHPVFRHGLRDRLAAEPGLAVVADVGTAADALALLAAVAVDVVVLDLNLPDLSGARLVRAVCEAAPDSAVLVLTMLDDESVVAALRAGACGYLLKDTEAPRIVEAVRGAALHETTISPSVAHHVVGALTRHPRTATPPGLPELTERELDLMRLVGGGLSNAEIARRLNLAPKTVRNYVSVLLDKLHASDRAQAGQIARDAGLVPVTNPPPAGPQVPRSGWSSEAGL